MDTTRGFIGAKKVGVVAAGNTTPIMAMADIRMPLESFPLQALVSEPVKPVFPCVVMSNTVHAYISQSDKGELVIGAGTDQYTSYSQTGGLHILNHTLEAICEMFPMFSRMNMLRSWGGIVDVTPDRQEIVFDLLGDIYSLPIAGGEAKSLTSGAMWDMQPRFSPDGKRIAFTSDRAGGDNIWVMNRDGSDPRQVTKESFRLLNSPAWSPDGQYIAARKHFTAQRSLGAGEIWIYHHSGGDGLQVTNSNSPAAVDASSAASAARWAGRSGACANPCSASG